VLSNVTLDLVVEAWIIGRTENVDFIFFCWTSHPFCFWQLVCTPQAVNPLFSVNVRIEVMPLKTHAIVAIPASAPWYKVSIIMRFEVLPGFF
jgi:hypothetical protein